MYHSWVDEIPKGERVLGHAVGLVLNLIARFLLGRRFGDRVFFILRVLWRGGCSGYRIGDGWGRFRGTIGNQLAQ
jgi:hypothetical protein